MKRTAVSTRVLRQILPIAFGLLIIGLAQAQKAAIRTIPGADSSDSRESTGAPSTLTLFFQPMFILPLGPSTDLFAPSGAGAFGLEYDFPGQIQPFVAASIGYAFIPVKADTSVSVLIGEAVGGIYFWLSPRIALRAAAGAGGWYGFLNDEGIGNGQLTAQAGAGLQYLFSPSLSLGLEARYRYQLGLYQGLEVAASTSLALSGREGRMQAIQRARQIRLLQQGPKTPEKGRGIELANLELYEIFPVFHKFYDDHPVGLVTLVNKEKTPISGIKLSFLIKQYMDSPKDCPAPTELDPGARQDVALMSLLTDRVLEVTEATKVAADITLDYRMGGEQYRETRTLTARVLDRNAMTWEDDRRAAAFVTAKDPAVLAFAKGVTGPLRNQGPEAIDGNFISALGLFTALDVHGLSYVVDPKTPFTEFSAQANQVDFLQFPRQTLEYKAGDCDDLSILYAALLEAVGIETAFITVPGHIYIAFATGLYPDEASRRFSATDDLIEKNGVVWVPVEVTERRGGFLKAWATGAKEWREAQAEGTARFLPLHDAWKEYEPVGLPGSGAEATVPAGQALLVAFRQEVSRFTEHEITPRAARLQDEIRKSGDSPPARNKLGVLYAQYGRLELAEAEFRQAVAKQEYTPALVNLGNLFLLKEQPKLAQEFYERAAKKEPQNPKVLLGLAKIYHQTEQYERARMKHEELAAVDRILAERYAYLGASANTTSRAGDTEALRLQVLWAE